MATIDANILTENEDSIVNIFLFGKPNSDLENQIVKIPSIKQC